MNADQKEFASASLRVIGDELDPTVITDALALQPNLSYRKGETYRAGRRRQRDVVGRTGLWLLSTDYCLESGRLEDHLELLASLLRGRAERLDLFRQIVREGGYEASAICFWAGPAGSDEPTVPSSFRDLVAQLGGEVLLDFYPTTKRTISQRPNSPSFST